MGLSRAPSPESPTPHHRFLGATPPNSLKHSHPRPWTGTEGSDQDTLLQQVPDPGQAGMGVEQSSLNITPDRMFLRAHVGRLRPAVGKDSASRGDLEWDVWAETSEILD